MEEIRTGACEMGGGEGTEPELTAAAFCGTCGRARGDSVTLSWYCIYPVGSLANFAGCETPPHRGVLLSLYLAGGAALGTLIGGVGIALALLNAVVMLLVVIGGLHIGSTFAERANFLRLGQG